MANALAKDSTLQSMLVGLVGVEPERTAKVVNINFDATMFESGGIDNTTGQNKNETGYYRTREYIAIPTNKWKVRLTADRPFLTTIYYYDENMEYQGRDFNTTGYCDVQNYPYCKIKCYHRADYISDMAEFLRDRLKIQYIQSAPAENEYFLHNYLFNGNFEYDRNNDGIADGWTLLNSPSSYSVSENVQSITPSAQNYFLRMDADGKLTGHKVYCSFEAYTPYDICAFVAYTKTVAVVAKNTKFTRASGIIEAVNSGVNPQFTCGSNAVGHEILLKNIMMIDLTDIYGEGNEPSAEEIDEIIDKWYNGYVPIEYAVKYDDSGLPVSIMDRLKNIDTSSDKLTVKNGEVTAVSHYVGGELKSKTIINRDKFGNLVSVEEV